jgi:hypothetical protein
LAEFKTCIKAGYSIVGGVNQGSADSVDSRICKPGNGMLDLTRSTARGSIFICTGVEEFLR